MTDSNTDHTTLTGSPEPSPVSSPAKGENGAQRPNAPQHGDLYAESTDSVYVHDAVNGLWTGFDRSDGDDLYEDELPEDAAPLHGITHNIYDVREIDRLRAKIADVEAIAGRLALDLTHRDDRIATAERNWYTLSHIVGAIEDDPAEDVFELARKVVATADRADAAEAKLAKVREFCAERAQYITAINNCHPDNAADYYRWQGGAEARRQLSERLGLPTAWPAEMVETVNVTVERTTEAGQ